MSSQSLPDLLLKIALKSDMAIKYGCVIEYRKNILATGFNSIDWRRFQHGRGNRQCILRA
jgi:deoxycytidylate deaminase